MPSGFTSRQNQHRQQRQGIAKGFSVEKLRDLGVDGLVGNTARSEAISPWFEPWAVHPYQLRTHKPIQLYNTRPCMQHPMKTHALPTSHVKYTNEVHEGDVRRPRDMETCACHPKVRCRPEAKQGRHFVGKQFADVMQTFAF